MRVSQTACFPKPGQRKCARNRGGSGRTGDSILEENKLPGRIAGRGRLLSRVEVATSWQIRRSALNVRRVAGSGQDQTEALALVRSTAWRTLLLSRHRQTDESPPVACRGPPGVARGFS